jgi:hypothetical protein
VLSKSLVAITRREGLGVNRLDPESVTRSSDVVTRRATVSVISAGTAIFSHVHAVFFAGVAAVN